MKNLKLWSLALAAVVAFSACSEDEKDDDNNNNNEPTKVGVQGEWQSSGSNVAPLLVSLFGYDSLYVDFRTDMTYTVEAFDTANAKSTLTGTYTQEESGVNNIWTITLDQTSPSTLTSEGIFRVSGDTLKYEVVQTTPDIGATPPTAADGFGSTSGGSFGMTNVQTYLRID